MIRRAKWLELVQIVLITHLSTFDSIVPLTLKIMDFENVALTKNYPYICDKRAWMHNNHDIKSSFSQNVMLNGVSEILNYSL